MTSPYSTGSISWYSNYTGNSKIDPLLTFGLKWGTGGAGVGATVSYSFPSSGAVWAGNYGEKEPFKGFQPFTAGQQAAAHKALAAWSAVANISFVEVADKPSNVGDIRFGNSAAVHGTGFAAWAYPPHTHPKAGDIWFDKSYGPNLQLGRGQFGYSTMLHEIGHAIGLDHPFFDRPGDVVLPKAQDNQRYTIMSYTRYSGASKGFEAYGPMLYDILAIQYIYGANMTTRAGNTVYKFTTSQEYLECIWDAGGHDTIDLSSQTRNQVINLNAGSFSSIGIRNDGKTAAGNVSIAFNVTIEDAIGGAGSDTITGNSAANRLRGGGGTDRINGAAGNDRLEGDAGNDVLKGGAGNDVLVGGVGNDTMEGGAGNDTYYLDSLKDVIVESAGGGIDTICTPFNFVLSSGSTIENITLLGTAKNGTGNAYSNTITGNNVANVLNGQDGADVLRGGGGNDRLVGGNGNDRLEGGAGFDLLQGGVGDDTLVGGTGNDTMQGGAGNDTYGVDSLGDVVSEAGGNGIDTVQASFNFVLNIANVENLTLIGTAISGTGDALDNTIVGNAQDNILDGAGGNDLLKGGAGNDTYIVDDDGDVVDEEANTDANDTVKTSLSNTTAFIGVETYIYTGAAAWTFTAIAEGNKAVGGALDDTLTGGLGDDYLDGQGSADVMKGGAGNDTYVVDSLSDIVDEEANTDTNDLVISSLLITGAIAGIESYSYTGAIAWAFTGDSLANYLSGGAANDTLSGADGNDTLAGNGGDDVLAGGADDDWLDGGTGNDTLQGGAGNDTYVVDSLADVVDEEANADTGDLVRTSALIAVAFAGVENYIYTGASAWTFTGNTDANWITGGALNDKLDGAAGNDTLVGNAGNDTLIGGLGDDYLDGGSGNNALKGGAGNDTYVLNSGTVIDEEGNTDTDDLVRSSLTVNLATLAGGLIEHAVLLGTAALNATGNGAANELTGNDAANVLDGGAGADILTGGLGNDTYIVDNLGDQVIEAVGGGFDLVKSSVSFSLAGQNAENLILTGSAAIDATGNGLGNVLTGNDGANRLDGGAGDDTLVGGKGDDTYVVDSWGDVINESVLNNAGGGIDTVESSLYSFLLEDYTNIENLTLTGTAYQGVGNALANTIIGNSLGNNLVGFEGNDMLLGGGGNDDMTGSDGNDTLLGGGGDDDMNGSDGNDVLRGGAGSDDLIGGLGQDTFDYDLLSEAGDWIWDFTIGADGDVLDLRDLMDSIGYGGTDPVTEGYLSFVQDYVGTMVRVDADGSGAGAATDLVRLFGVTFTSTDTSNYLV